MAGANHELTTHKTGYSPLFLASNKGYTEVVKLLVNMERTLWLRPLSVKYV